MVTLDVYYDYASPFAYLASELLPAFAGRVGVTLCWKPIDLMGLSNYAGGLPYSQVKRRYVVVDAARSAEFHGVPIRVPKPHPVQSGAALRLAHELRDDTRFAELHAQLFRAAWHDQRDLSSEDVLTSCLAASGGDRDGVLARAGQPEAHRALAAATAEAEAAGVFGVPTMVTRGELFWGLDSLPALEWRLTQSRG